MQTQIFGPYLGTVDKVQDGDTIYVKLDLGFDLTVYARCRIRTPEATINAPELSTTAGKEAKAFALDLLPPNSIVQVHSYGWDKYGGRIDATIQLPDGRDFGQVMLDSGQAIVTKY